MTKVNRLLLVLGKTSAATDKKRLLASLKEDEVAREVVVAALDPFVTYGVLPSEIPEPDVAADETFAEEWPKVKSLLDELARRDLTGNMARDAVERCLKQPYGAVLARVLSKDLRAGIRAKTVNTVIKGLIPVFDVALASEGPIFLDGVFCPGDAELHYPLRAEPKLDGVRTLTTVDAHGVVEMRSRNGLPYENFPHAVEAIRSLGLRSRVFDGEMAGRTFDSVMQVAHRKQGGDDSDLLYYIFDTMPLETFQTQTTKMHQTRRSEELVALLARAPERLVSIEHRWVENQQQMEEYFWQVRKRGFEGLILKNPNMVYEFKRGKAWYKVKEWYSAEGPIVNVLEGTKKNKGKMGALAAEFDGLVTEVGSGFSDEQRVELWAHREELIGRVIEVKYQEKTKDGCLRFPVFLRWREDKE